MSILKVSQMGHPVLRRAADPVHPDQIVTEPFQRLVTDMRETMAAYEGAGLAAPQVHVSARLLVYRAGGDEGVEAKSLTLVNPVIEPLGEETASVWEGCLSIPGVSAAVTRPSQIHLEAYNLQGQPFGATLSDVMARVVQHENDHLDGVLFIDRVATADKLDLEPTLDELAIEFQSRRDRGEIPDDEQILTRLAEFEERYC